MAPLSWLTAPPSASARHPTRSVLWTVFLVVAVSIAWVSFPTSSIAQDNPAAQANNAGVPLTEEPNGASSAPKLSLGDWMFRALGVTYTVAFLFLSFLFVGLTIINILSSRHSQICPPSLVESFEAKLDDRKYQEAYEIAKADESFLGNVLSAGLGKINAGYDRAIEAMQEVGEEENMKLDHRLSYIALIGTISPMVGLFGTVDGMIRSFWVIATAGGTPKPALLADGVSTALLTTLVGLAIAIPAIAVYSLLRNRVQRLVLEVGITSENLMSRFENVPKKS